MITTTILTWMSKLFLETGWVYFIVRLVILCLLALFALAVHHANKTNQNIPRDRQWIGRIIVLAAVAWVIVPRGQQVLNSHFREWKTSLEPGLEAYKAEDYEKAVPILAEAAEAFPEAALIHLYLGSAHRELGNQELAAEAYKRVLQTADTGHWPVRARERLREMGVASPLVTEPDRVEMNRHDLRSMQKEGSPVAQSLVKGLLWFFILSSLLAGYCFLWILLSANQENDNPVPKWFIYVSLFFLIMWVQAHSAGAYNQLWFTGLSGWHPYWLGVRVIFSMTLALCFAICVRENTQLCTYLLIFVLCAGLAFLGMAWLGNRSDKVAILLAGVVSVVSFTWGAGALHSLGDLSDSPVLGALTRAIIAVFAWLIMPVAAHVIVFFKVMPWLAVQRGWSIPGYFWESTLIRWIQNVSGGLL